ncbi:MAG: immunoglobulin domain-containing protein [Verrucomicrobia bacterium]|nr:immunoglobulin domain-containing protein [Verrucomicrobiota bacterium]
MKKLITACVALCALFGLVVQGISQSSVFNDPSQPFGSFMNVTDLPINGGGYQFGVPGWAAKDLRATNYADVLKLQACTNVSNPGDAYWVIQDGSGRGNKQMDASWYVDTASLVNSNITFSGNVVDCTLTTNYVCQAFIKVFNASYSSVLQSSVQTLSNANSFFSLNLTANAAGAAHIQYGFETVGPNAPWTNSPDSDGYITIRANAADPKNALVNPGFENGLAGWTSYGNGGNIELTGNTYYNGGNAVGASNVLVYEGLKVQKVFPTFTGGANYSGIYQDIPTGAGSTWSATAKLLTHHQDHIGVWDPDGTNQCWIEVTFRDGADSVLATYKSPVIDSLSPVDAWIDMTVTNDIIGGTTLTAPAGTTKVRLQEVYYQPYGYAGGSVYADKMVLDNLSPSDPNITTLPLSQTKLVGETVIFSVVASGATTLSYQWKTNNVNVPNGGNISGATTSTLTIANVQKSQQGTYSVDVTDSAGTLTASANLTVKTCDEAANALDNPGFETGTYSPWATFNGGGLKTNGDFWAGITIANYEGIIGSVVENGGEYDGAYQDVPASPGQIFSADGWFFESSTYQLTEANQVWLEVQFRNGGTPIALYKSAIIGTNDPARPLDAWYNLQATNGFAGDFVTPIPNATYLVAPANTTVVRYQVTMHVVGGSGGILYDNMHLLKKLPVTVTAAKSSGNITLSWPSQCSTSYKVAYKDNLNDSSWTETGSVISGDGGTKSASFPTTDAKRFYTVLTK